MSNRQRFVGISTCFESFTKMGIYYREQSGKGFKTKLKVSEEELEKYLETWDRDEDLLGFSFLKCYDTENDCHLVSKVCHKKFTQDNEMLR